MTVAQVVLYGTPFCSYCFRARRLLQTKGVAFRDIDVSDRTARVALAQRVGTRLVPQIFINGRNVGGFDEISALDEDGALDELLSEPPSEGPLPNDSR